MKLALLFIYSLMLSTAYAQATSSVFKLKNDTPFPQISKWDTYLTKTKHKKSKMNSHSKPVHTPYYTVVIDAGHGGRDFGAKGLLGRHEKDIVLSIAKKLKARLNQIPKIRTILTREDDVFVSLRGRLQIARKNHADLFIAIHADAYFNHRAKGASVYALSPRGATSEAARWIAQQDNYSQLGEIKFHQLKDGSVMLRSVLIDLAQTVTIQDSLKLGNNMLASLKNITSLHHKKVEQARFVVLKSPDIPSILVETGFISHPWEEKHLANPTYQAKIAQALANGIQKYLRTYAKSR